MKYLKKTYRHILLLFLFILLAYPVTGNSEYVQKRFLGDIVNELGIDLGDANAFLIPGMSQKVAGLSLHI